MVRYAEARLAPFYEAAKRFVDEALRHDGSLFTPGMPIWSADNIQELYHRFVEQPDTGSDPFEVKLQHQIQGAPSYGYTTCRGSALCSSPDCAPCHDGCCSQAKPDKPYPVMGSGRDYYPT